MKLNLPSGRIPDEIITEITHAVASVPDTSTLVSLHGLEDFLNSDPDQYPNLISLKIPIRRATITRTLNRIYPQRNTSGKNPKNRVWIIRPAEVADVC